MEDLKKMARRFPFYNVKLLKEQVDQIKLSNQLYFNKMKLFAQRLRGKSATNVSSAGGGSSLDNGEGTPDGQGRRNVPRGGLFGLVMLLKIKQQHEAAM